MRGRNASAIEPKVLRLLIYLIENRNRLVRKQELLDKVWPDAMVTENALTRAVGLLRKALNDDIRVPRFIETVPTAGYRFIAGVTVAEDSSAVAPAPPVESISTSVKLRPSTPWVVASSVVLLAGASACTFLYLHRGKKVLTDQDTVVLADFDNSTGDPVFDSTLRRGMAVQLEQSPYLSLIADDRIQQVLQEMGQPPDARLTPAIAREICERTASAAVLDGSIASLGSQYVLGLRAKDCRVARSWPRNRCRRPEKKMCCTPSIKWRANSERRSVNPSQPSRSTTLRWRKRRHPHSKLSRLSAWG